MSAPSSSEPTIAPQAPVPFQELKGRSATGTRQEMTVMEHLGELRRRIIVSVVALALGVLAAFFLSVPVMDSLKHLAPAGAHFVQLTPGEVFMASFRLSFFLGVILASPVILYQALRFVLPGLNPKEQRFLSWIVLGGSLLFALGVLFAYYAVIPPSLQWLLEFGKDVAEIQMSIAPFTEFCTSILLLTGILFELPMVLLLLSFTGLVSAQQLVDQWRAAIVIIFIVAAVATPSQDPFSMTVVAIAMLGLYWLSILSIKLFNRR